jgi:hypothetical protein
MRKSTFTKEEIIKVLKEHRPGCWRVIAIARQNFYNGTPEEYNPVKAYPTIGALGISPRVPQLRRGSDFRQYPDQSELLTSR